MIQELTNFYAPRLGNAYETRCDGDWRYPAHRHAGTSDLVICHDGMMTHTVNNEVIVLEPDQMLWVQDHDIHSVFACNAHFSNIDVPHSVLELLASGLSLQDRLDRHVRNDGRPVIALGDYKEIIQWKLATVLEKQYEPEGSIHLRSLLADLLAIMFLKEESRERALLPWMDDIYKYIHLNLNTVCSGDLPAITGYTAAHISRTFKAAFDETPSQYINRLRIERASARLAASNEDISHICFELGFKSLSYFYRLFQRYRGLSPLTYRRQHNPLFR